MSRARQYPTNAERQRAYRKRNRNAIQAARKTLRMPYYQDELVTLYCGDSYALLPLLPDASVDLVFTDPPYPREYLDTYRLLAHEAARLVMPSGFVYAYSGSERLPDVLARMAPPLTWFWSFTVQHAAPSKLWPKGLRIRSKPLLAFTNGPPPRDPRWSDTDHPPEGADKRYHTWGQSIGVAMYHIIRRTAPGAVVLDPFAGGGTTLAAAKRLGRKAIGIEIDASQCAIVADRLSQQVMELGDVGAMDAEQAALL